MKIDENRYRYTLSQIVDLANENQYKNISITSSLKESMINIVIDELKKISAENNFDINFDVQKDGNLNLIKAYAPQDNYDSLKTLKNSDGVILIEKLSTTTHKRFDELINILQQNNINIIGVVTM